MLFLKKKKKKENGFVNIKNKALAELESLGNDLDSLVKTVNAFFSLFFNIKYNFTFAEFKREISKRKFETKISRRIKVYYKTVSEMKYRHEKPKTEELTKMKHEFREIIKLLTQKKETKEKFFMQNYLSKATRILSKPVIVKKIDLSQVEIYDIIKEIRTLINKKKYDEARIKYSLLVKAYNNIPQKEKKQAYFHMKKLYEKLISYV